MLSIVIPALNEEKYLKRLLKRLQAQTFKDFEIIVADADSKDRTKAVARYGGARVVRGGYLPKGRNVGARATKGEIILFLDADVFFEKDFLEKALKEFQERKLDLASFRLIPLSRSYWPKLFFNLFFNYPLMLFSGKWCRGSMAILVKKNLHKKLGGFDEKSIVCEDHDYIKRGSQEGTFAPLRKSWVFFSLRRFYQEGWIRTSFQYLFFEIHLIFLGPVRKEFFRYRYDYPKDKII
jgi:glycosyltransferase involved in cell wall biosynthesis